MAFQQIAFGTDWQSTGFVNQFIKAWNERMPEDPYSSGDLVDIIAEKVAGEDIQLRSFWGGLQSRIEAQIAQTTYTKNVWGIRWLIPYDEYQESYETPPTIPSNFLQACELIDDISDYGWRRATTWYPDGGDNWQVLDGGMWDRPENGHGQMRAGDIIGPWIFDDLMTMFDNMRTRYYSYAGNSSHKLGRGQYRVATAGGGADRAAMTAIWLGTPATDYMGRMLAVHNWDSFNLRQSYARVAARYGIWSGNTSTDFSILDPTNIAYGAVDGDNVHYFQYGTRPDVPGSAVGDWDANGDGLIENEYANFVSGTLGAVTDMVGTIDEPPAQYVDRVSKGYYGYNTFGIINLNDLEWIK